MIVILTKYMSGSLCKYKDILGIPGKGAHSYRFFNIAIVDVFLTLVLSYLLSIMFKKSYIVMIIMMFILGIILHRVFCVKTTIDKLLY